MQNKLTDYRMEMFKTSSLRTSSMAHPVYLALHEVEVEIGKLIVELQEDKVYNE